MALSARTLGAMATPRPATHDTDTDPDPDDVAAPDADDLDPDQLDHLPDARPAIDLSFLDDADPDEDVQP